MTATELDRFLLAAMVVCAAGALLNLAMVKRRGTSAILMALAFLALGGTMQLYRTTQSRFLTGAGSLAVVGLLMADVAIRQSRPRPKR